MLKLVVSEMGTDLNDLIYELKDLLSQLQELIQSSNTFNRYILPALIAGLISAAGIIINNFISVYVFKKKRSLEYGKFYLPYLSYLKDIACEMECLPSEQKENIFYIVISMANLPTREKNIHIRKIVKNLFLIDELFAKNTYYIINRNINKDVLKLQTIIVLLNKYKDRAISFEESTKIEEKLKNLNFNINEHITEIETNS